ncbi:MAG: type II toxin-antitoxin system VapC family toxin [Phycisphaerales bacterium]|jgi:predicted nucleic acid-binding protein
MNRPSVYIETTIVSYLAARPSPGLLTAACQQITADWWEKRRGDFELFTSEIVMLEARNGDPDAVARRLEILEGIAQLVLTDGARELARAFLAEKAVPRKAQGDALHIATAAAHRIDYLLTWNCRHINNPEIKPSIRRVCESVGFSCPEICTPIEIMEIGYGRE